MNILGNTKMIVKEYDGRIRYSTRITQKNKNGEWEGMFLDVSFVGNASNPSIQDKDIINITKGFLGFYQDKNGLCHVKYIVQDFDKNEELTYQDEERRGIMESDNINSVDKLPF